MNPFQNLHYLDLSKNKLGIAISYDHYAESIFSKLKEIQVLILSYNGISYLPADSFKGCSSLQVLDLSHNNLSTLSFKTDYLQSLLTLDLSFNNISYVNFSSLNALNKSSGENPSLQSTKDAAAIQDNARPDIKLKGNNFSCSCELLQLLKRLEMLNETNMCSLGDIVVVTNLVIRKTEYLCKVSVVQVFTSLGVTEVILIVVTACCIRKELMKMKLKRKLRKAVEHYKTNSHMKFAAFLSMCGLDTDFVIDNIYAELDTALKKQVNTTSRCVSVGDLDFRPGLSVGNEIIRCVEESFTVLFVKSNKFCNSEWCKNEMLAAYAAGKPTRVGPMVL